MEFGDRLLKIQASYLLAMRDLKGSGSGFEGVSKLG